MPTPLPASVRATAQPFFKPHSPAVPMAPYTPREPDEAPSTTQGLAGLKLSGTCTAITVRLRPEPSSSTATYSRPGIRPSLLVTVPVAVTLGPYRLP